MKPGYKLIQLDSMAKLSLIIAAIEPFLGSVANCSSGINQYFNRYNNIINNSLIIFVINSIIIVAVAIQLATFTQRSLADFSPIKLRKGLYTYDWKEFFGKRNDILSNMCKIIIGIVYSDKKFRRYSILRISDNKNLSLLIILSILFSSVVFFGYFLAARGQVRCIDSHLIYIYYDKIVFDRSYLLVLYIYSFSLMILFYHIYMKIHFNIIYRKIVSYYYNNLS